MAAHATLFQRLSRQLMADPATGCLNWSASLSHNGYGRIRIGGAGSARAQAHRVAYEEVNGPIPPGLEIDHLCRNRRCCNPDHLEAVTRKENIRRGNAPHMVNARKTHCKRGHEFTLENTRLNSRGERICRPCESAFRKLQPSRMDRQAACRARSSGGVSRRWGRA